MARSFNYFLPQVFDQYWRIAIDKHSMKQSLTEIFNLNQTWKWIASLSMNSMNQQFSIWSTFMRSMNYEHAASTASSLVLSIFHLLSANLSLFPGRTARHPFFAHKFQFSTSDREVPTRGTFYGHSTTEENYDMIERRKNLTPSWNRTHYLLIKRRELYRWAF